MENILRLNRGKVASFHMTYENNNEWNARVFRGIVEEAGRDHIIVSEVDGSNYYILLMVNLDFVEFDDPIEYEYPFSAGPVLTQYSPRPE
ncbi:spore coat protein GerQ [Bacillus sp. JCM 19034]|uniref:spore coat protein GerQ n=1 Tax=Bacillus sp. JCM 19034 TaxID=1481928 RepID=UPI0012E0D07A